MIASLLTGLKSWQTSLVGIILLAIGTSMVMVPLVTDRELGSQGAAMAASIVAAGLGFLASRDSDKTSEQVGAGSKR